MRIQSIHNPSFGCIMKTTLTFADVKPFVSRSIKASMNADVIKVTRTYSHGKKSPMKLIGECFEYADGRYEGYRKFADGTKVTFDTGCPVWQNRLPEIRKGKVLVDITSPEQRTKNFRMDARKNGVPTVISMTLKEFKRALKEFEEKVFYNSFPQAYK